MQIVHKKELEKEIVSSRGKTIFTNSLKFSEEFDLNHKHTLEKIRNLTADTPAVKNDYKESVFINERNRQYPYYEITRDGFMLLVMELDPKKKESRLRLREKRLLFIQAFNKMEGALLRQQNLEWKQTRVQSKEVRRVETDTIKQFVEYATDQGSKNAKFYYKHLTSAAYKALSLMEHAKPKTREMLDMMELHQLIIAESILTKVIEKEMNEGEHYKVIYEKCKQALEAYAGTLFLGGLDAK